MISIDLNTIKLQGFEISTGRGKPQFVKDDIAVIKVDDNNKTFSLLRPACLPTSDALPEQAVHTGWSSPPPLSALENDASGYLDYYRDFFKLWHLKMNVVPCMDPKPFNLELQSNSYYPSG